MSSFHYPVFLELVDNFLKVPSSKLKFIEICRLFQNIMQVPSLQLQFIQSAFLNALTIALSVSKKPTIYHQAVLNDFERLFHDFCQSVEDDFLKDENEQDKNIDESNIWNTSQNLQLRLAVLLQMALLNV